MPPTSPDPRDTIRWLTRILGALIQDSPKKELRVKMKTLKQLAGEGARQAIFEDTDSRRGEIVLRFGGRESAVYTIEPDTGTGTSAPCQPAAQPPRQLETARPTPQPQTVVTRTPPPSPPSNLPYTDEQLAAAERRIAQVRAANAIKRDRTNPNREPPI